MEKKECMFNEGSEIFNEHFLIKIQIRQTNMHIFPSCHSNILFKEKGQKKYEMYNYRK